MKNRKYILIIISIFALLSTIVVIILSVSKSRDAEISMVDNTDSSLLSNAEEYISSQGNEEHGFELGPKFTDDIEYRAEIDAIRLVSPGVIYEGHVMMDIMTIDEPVVGWKVVTYKMRSDHASFPMVVVIDGRSETPKVVVPPHHYATGPKYVNYDNLPPEINKQLTDNKNNHVRWRSFYDE